jgi:hypothetical protein
MLTRLVLIVETHDQPGGAPAGHLPPPVQPRPQRAHAGIGSGLLHPGTHANVSPVHVAPSVVGPLRPPAHHAVPTAREIPAFVTAKTRRVLPDTLRPVTARPRRVFRWHSCYLSGSSFVERHPARPGRQGPYRPAALGLGPRSKVMGWHVG